MAPVRMGRWTEVNRGDDRMHVVMTYPAHLALRGGDWAAAARRSGVDVTEIVLSSSLGTPPLPTIPWMAQLASRRYALQLPATKKQRKRKKRLLDRVTEAMNVVSNHHGTVDILHTHSAELATFAESIASELEIPHVHTPSHSDDETAIVEVSDGADLVRCRPGDQSPRGLSEMADERIRVIPTPIDFSIDGADTQLSAVDDAETALTSPGEPWLAAIRPRKIVWRGDVAGDEALSMIHTFAKLRFTGTQLELVGRDDVDHEIPELAQRLGLEGRLLVRPTGTPREMAQLIAESDLLIVGDDDALLEREVMTAALLGTAVVTPDTPTYRELVTRELGAIVPPGVPDALIRAVRRTSMVDVHDPVAMTARASRHTLASVGALLADAYHELVFGEARPGSELRLIETDRRQIAS